MTQVYVSVGSNVSRNKNICQCLTQLKSRFGDLQLSNIYENDAIGFDGDPFFNLVVGFKTELDLIELSKRLHLIEDLSGRDRSQPKFSPRTLDIDILLYDELVTDQGPVKLPRDEITRYAFVLKPLSELCAEQLHPVKQLSYQRLWNEFKSSEGAKSQNLVRVELDC